MICPFKIGDTQKYSVKVTNDKLARFDAGLVHPLYSTFALAQDAEWVCRLFVLEMKEAGEEGIGSHISIKHLSPALENEHVDFIATLKEISGNKIICDFIAKVGNRIIAEGVQTQHIINKAMLDKKIAELRMATIK